MLEPCGRPNGRGPMESPRGQDLPVIGVSIPRLVHMHGEYVQQSEYLEFIRLDPTARS